MTLSWNYLGVFPNGAEARNGFWGLRGIKSFAGDPTPHGVLSADTEITAPAISVITCSAVNTFAYAWQKSTDGNAWTDIPGEYASTLSTTYTLGQHGTYWYRCTCYGLVGSTTTNPITITVSEPAISVYLTASESSISIGETSLITCFITPYPIYAKSFKWQNASDGSTWIDMPDVTSQSYTFTGTETGITSFRVIATQYDDATVTSNELPIEITEE